MSAGIYCKYPDRRLAMEEIGCLPCYMEGRRGEPCYSDCMYAICPYHRDGTLPHMLDRPLTESEAWELYGPSRKTAPEAFETRYGRDIDLLEMQIALIGVLFRSGGVETWHRK